MHPSIWTINHQNHEFVSLFPTGIIPVLSFSSLVTSVFQYFLSTQSLFFRSYFFNIEYTFLFQSDPQNATVVTQPLPVLHLFLVSFLIVHMQLQDCGPICWVTRKAGQFRATHLGVVSAHAFSCETLFLVWINMFQRSQLWYAGDQYVRKRKHREAAYFHLCLLQQQMGSHQDD